jgi:hypothetical protein
MRRNGSGEGAESIDAAFQGSDKATYMCGDRVTPDAVESFWYAEHSTQLQ